MIEPPNLIRRALYVKSGPDGQTEVKDVIRLLMRCQQLYESKQLALIIFKQIQELLLLGENYKMPIQKLMLNSHLGEWWDDGSKVPMWVGIIQSVKERLNHLLDLIDTFQHLKMYNEKFFWQANPVKPELLKWREIVSGFNVLQAQKQENYEAQPDDEALV